MGIQSTGLSREERRAGSSSHAYSGDRVRSLREVADLLGISLPTLRRMISAGTGPIVTRLSERRLGIRDCHRDAWLNARASKTVAA
jgi:predicted DNA-binding transcriptional regulator AlpA